MKIKLKANPRGQFYFPKMVRDEWGHMLELTPSVMGGAIYPEGAPLEQVIESLQVVIADLKHRAQLENIRKNHSEASK